LIALAMSIKISSTSGAYGVPSLILLARAEEYGIAYPEYLVPNIFVYMSDLTANSSSVSPGLRGRVPGGGGVVTRGVGAGDGGVRNWVGSGAGAGDGEENRAGPGGRGDPETIEPENVFRGLSSITSRRDVGLGIPIVKPILEKSGVRSSESEPSLCSPDSELADLVPDCELLSDHTSPNDRPESFIIMLLMNVTFGLCQKTFMVYRIHFRVSKGRI
jgi:hypothetical protein